MGADFAVAEVVDLAKVEEFALMLGQPSEGLGDGSGPWIAWRRGRYRNVAGRLPFGVQHLPATALETALVATKAHGDDVEPRPKRARRIVRMNMLMNSNKYALDQVVGDRWVVGKLTSELPTEDRRKAKKELFKGGGVAARVGGCQLLIASFRSSRHRAGVSDRRAVSRAKPPFRRLRHERFTGRLAPIVTKYRSISAVPRGGAIGYSPPSTPRRPR